MKNDYDSIYEYYNTIMNFIPYREWANYIVKQFYAHNGIGKRVLDLGAGTCKLALLLEKKGFEVFAVDISYNMLSQLFKVGDNYKNIFPIVADISLLPIRKKFDMIICMYDTVNHIEHIEFERALRGIYELLEEHGIFMFDFNTPIGLSVFENARFKRVSGDTISIWNSDYNKQNNICSLKLEIYSNDKLIKECVFNERALTSEYVRNSCYNAGFNSITIYDFLSYEFIDKDTQRGFAICMKK